MSGGRQKSGIDIGLILQMLLSYEKTLAPDAGAGSLRRLSAPRIFRYFQTSPEIIRLTVMMYVRYPLSLRNVE